jgi:hypothetical protein
MTMDKNKSDNSRQKKDDLSKQKVNPDHRKNQHNPKDPGYNKKQGKGNVDDKARKDQVMAKINDEKEEGRDTHPKKDT